MNILVKSQLQNYYKKKSQLSIDEKNMEELEDKKPNIKLENSAEWLDDPANKIWTLGKFFKEAADFCIFVIKGYLSLY